MATGRLHSRASTYAALLSIPVGWYINGFLPAIQVSLGCWIGLVLTPDLDVEKGNISYYWIRRIHPLLERIWFWVWWPYSRAFQHRSWATHFPFISTGIRLAYLLWPVWLLFGWWLPPAWIILGLCISDIIHWLMDRRVFSRFFSE